MTESIPGLSSPYSAINFCPASDCSGANLKSFFSSCSIMKFTELSQKLHTPSNRMTGDFCVISIDIYVKACSQNKKGGNATVMERAYLGKKGTHPNGRVSASTVKFSQAI